MFIFNIKKNIRYIGYYVLKLFLKAFNVGIVNENEVNEINIILLHRRKVKNIKV